MQLNAIAVHDLVLAVLPGMIQRKAGGILISGSAAGNSPIPYNATYAATKAFANTFSESLRGELRKTGVHVTVLAPGPVRTELPDPAEASIVEKLVPDFLWISTEYTAKKSLDALAAQQDARGSRRDVQSDVGGQPVRAARDRRADCRKLLQEDGRLSYRRRLLPPPSMLRMSLGAQRLKEGLEARGCSRNA